MVEVEIRSPAYDEEAGRIEWRRRALVRAEGGDLAIYQSGDGIVVREDMSVVDVATGAQVTASDDPETWARNLPYAYRAGDLVAAVILDSAGTPVAETDVRALPTVPTPPDLAGIALATS